MLPGKQYQPEDILRILRQRKWLLILPFLVISALGISAVRTLPDRYQSQTLILIVPQRVPESYVRATVTARIEDRLPAIGQEILSRSRLERIITDFGLYANEREKGVMEDVVEKMRNKDITVAIERGDAFRITYSNGDPKLAQKVTERLASLFIEENLRDREVLAEGTNQFLDAQLEDAKRQLIEQEKRLEQYRRQYAGQLPSQVETNLSAITTARMQLQTLDNAVNGDRDRRLILQRQLADVQTLTPVAGTPSYTVPSTRTGGVETQPTLTKAQQLASLTAQLRALETRYRPEHPDILNAKRLIRDAEIEASKEAEAFAAAQAAAEKAAAANETQADAIRQTARPEEAARVTRLRELREELRNLDTQIERKQAEERRLRDVITQYQARIDSAPTRETEMTELMRDYTTLQGTYTSLLAKREDSKIAANLERRQIGEQFKVLDPARVPEKPISPDRPKLNLMVLVAGFGMGFVLLGLMEFKDNSLKTADDAARVLNLPVLALVPAMETDREKRQRRRRRLLVGATATVVVLGSIAALVIFNMRSI